MSILPRCNPEAQGVASISILTFIEALRARQSKAHELHSFMYMRNGSVIAEGWWAPYKREMPHMLFSLSKSFTSTAVGIAVGEGRLSVDDEVVSFFPERVPDGASDYLRSMRVRHLLTMSTGHSQDVSDFIHADEGGDWVRGFFRAPVEHEPGTHFCYNTPATYVLSAIVHKLTGQTLVEYLQPRLFEPLGIARVSWQTCPMGVNTGGYGLAVTTEDIARFGQLLLNNGNWFGRQLIPADWVRRATSKIVDNAPGFGPDWEQGYGYKFWRCRHGGYRGDGAFGQYCIVLPEQAVVLAMTGAVNDMQAILDSVWSDLLPGIHDGPLQEDSCAYESLMERLCSLKLDPSSHSAGCPNIQVNTLGKRYTLESNPLGLQSLYFGEGATVLVVRSGDAQHSISIRAESWSEPVGFWGESSPVCLAGMWTDDGHYELTTRRVYTPFCETITCVFDQDFDGVTATMTGNVAFGEVPHSTLRGILERLS